MSQVSCVEGRALVACELASELSSEEEEMFELVKGCGLCWRAACLPVSSR